ncbi:hypothetical protein DENSPDRAFT_845938 [Dentipellis sp. KUC8613]|nr:hypothetical protein DENSPDRAFT_845938 [Dentipellis sp. KUC8613]
MQGKRITKKSTNQKQEHNGRAQEGHDEGRQARRQETRVMTRDDDDAVRCKEGTRARDKHNGGGQAQDEQNESAQTRRRRANATWW